MENLIQVKGFADVLLGYWNESENKFEKINENVINDETNSQWKHYPVLPLMIQISKTKVNDEYQTYRSIATKPNERTLIYINNLTSENKLLQTI